MSGNEHYLRVCTIQAGVQTFSYPNSCICKLASGALNCNKSKDALTTKQIFRAYEAGAFKVNHSVSGMGCGVGGVERNHCLIPGKHQEDVYLCILLRPL